MTNDIFDVTLHSDFIEEFRALGASPAVRGASKDFCAVYDVPEAQFCLWVELVKLLCPDGDFFERNFFPVREGWEMTFAGVAVVCGVAGALQDARENKELPAPAVWAGATVEMLLGVFSKPESEISLGDALFIRDVVPWLCEWVDIGDHKFMDVKVVPAEDAA